MVSALLTLPATLFVGVVRHSGTAAHAVDDDDACPSCDHPFRYMRHACVGVLDRV